MARRLTPLGVALAAPFAVPFVVASALTLGAAVCVAGVGYVLGPLVRASGVKLEDEVDDPPRDRH